MRPEIKRILFAQNAAVIDQQRQLVTDRLREALGAQVEFASQPGDLALGSTFDAVIAPTVAWLPELLGRIEGTPWVHFLSSGVEKIWAMDVDWAQYTLTSSKGVHAIPISEYVLGAMLHFAKRFDQFTSQAREGVWERAWLPELTDAQVVIVGAGSIGREVASRCRFLGMQIQAVARTARTDADLGNVLDFAQLSQAAASADYLVVAVPLTAETAGLVGEDVLSSTKQGAVLIDVSRGGVVSEDAVVSALASGILRGAALDVFEEEPLSAGSQLWGRPNVLITPHVAGTTPRYIERALDVFVANAERLVAGQEPATFIDASQGY
ncbi:Phosphoglycerate dehydrogenase [Tessaracoccus bendigoensis DSM 12906]|uniref:Phosphoglycerate dehydrogenase n=1 Tax=Tessaracoccus bendigoensis DSM 12906 TaxID=1123357 RepID=A0A1M6K7S9_9ACTN|nr:D-2-hydroxyacid dehydrogenase [Tessaracoccus bendigoensis]SHJ54917.1 Phosphoglycerate dehydrogenase [Tessaracoccus bendigoensis DSM 12906]